MTPLLDAEALEALAVRVEQATGPDRELDAAIARTVYACPPGHHVEPDKSGHAAGVVRDAQGRINANIEWLAYTASLDAAMSLVPEGLELTLHVDALGPYVQVRNDHGGVELSAFAKTLALALTAASLRAIASRLREGEDSHA